MFIADAKFALVINMYAFLLLVEKIETYIRTLEQSFFYLLTKTLRYGGSVFGTEAAGGAQTE